MQGGSTITQQYVKQVLVNAADTPEEVQAAQARTLSRKIRELRYALALEKQYSKDEILERYLNIAYFGAGAYGVEAAARRYFSKSAADLTLVEAATLAGVVQQPIGYDPIRNPAASQKRRAMVLTRMVEQGYLTAQVAAAAAKVPTQSFLKPRTVSNGCTSSSAPFFCDYVLQVMKNDPAFGDTPTAREALLRQGGLTIRTTLDPKIQADAMTAVTAHIPTKDPSRKLAAMSMVQPGSGKILAMAQNRDWGIKGRGKTTYDFNVGTKYGGSLGAQSGSTFKVFTLAAALEKGISPYEKIESPQNRTFRGFRNCTSGVEYPPYNVNNSTGAGTFNMLQGTSFSINTYFMALEKRTGLCRPAEIAESMGLRQGNGDSLNRVPSFTLGTDSVTPLGVAEAYATFANHGEHCDSVAITRVTDRDGAELKVPAANCSRVIPREIADSVTAILSQVIDGPLAGRTGAAMSLGRDAAGKTGTINNSAAVWFAGFTPDLAAAVWTGDPRGGYGHPMQNVTINGRYYSQVFGSTLPGPIWKQAMSAALEGTPPTKFDLRTIDGLGVYVPPPPKPGQARQARQARPRQARARQSARSRQSGRPRRSAWARCRPPRGPGSHSEPGHQPGLTARPDGPAGWSARAERRLHGGGDTAAVGPARDLRREQLHDRAHGAHALPLGACRRHRPGHQGGQLLVGQRLRQVLRQHDELGALPRCQLGARRVVERLRRLAALLGLAPQHHDDLVVGQLAGDVPETASFFVAVSAIRSVAALTSSRLRMAVVRSCCNRSWSLPMSPSSRTAIRSGEPRGPVMASWRRGRVGQGARGAGGGRCERARLLRRRGAQVPAATAVGARPAGRAAGPAGAARVRHAPDATPSRPGRVGAIAGAAATGRRRGDRRLPRPPTGRARCAGSTRPAARPAGGLRARLQRLPRAGARPAVAATWPARRPLAQHRAALPWGDLVAGLTDAGWLDLSNRRGRLSVAGREVEVRGVDDPHIERDRYDQVGGPFDPGADLALGVTHAPYLRVLDAMAGDGAGLVLAGHTHGGQLCLPGIGALITNCDLAPAQAKGLSRHARPGSDADRGSAARRPRHPAARVRGGGDLALRAGAVRLPARRPRC